MGILDILSQHPTYEHTTSAQPLSLFTTFIPTFLQPICDVWDENKQYVVRNKCLDTLRSSWDYAWGLAEAYKRSSRLLIPSFIREIQYPIDTPDHPRFENLFKPWYCSDALHA
jgi:hypothetical protein